MRPPRTEGRIPPETPAPAGSAAHTPAFFRHRSHADAAGRQWFRAGDRGPHATSSRPLRERSGRSGESWRHCGKTGKAELSGSPSAWCLPDRRLDQPGYFAVGAAVRPPGFGSIPVGASSRSRCARPCESRSPTNCSQEATAEAYARTGKKTRCFRMKWESGRLRSSRHAHERSTGDSPRLELPPSGNDWSFEGSTPSWILQGTATGST